MRKYSLNKWPLPFKVRLEIGKLMFRDNPDKGEVIVAWVLNQDGKAADLRLSSPGTRQSEM